MGRIHTLTLAAVAAAVPTMLGAAPAEAAAPLRAAPLAHSIDLHAPHAVAPRGLSPFVIGGAPAVDGTLPSVAYIAVRFADDSAAACTGSVIAPTFVVTAAHCFVSESRVLEVAVATGAHDLTQLRSGVGQVIAATHAEIDPDYDPGTAAHDAAVLTLASPTTTPAVPLATPAEITALGPQTPLTIAGWGLTVGADSGDTPPQLQTAQVLLQDAGTCEHELDRINTFDPRLFLCTDTPGHTTGTCHGDSGGPLLWTAPSGVQELVGITDWGFDRCTPPISAFTNLATVGPWVLYAAGLGPQPPRDTTPQRTGPRPKPTHRPHISGKPVPGGTLTCHIGAWRNRPTSFSVDWLYNGKRVPGVHSTRVRLSAEIHGGWARCAVTARNASGTSQSSSKGIRVRHTTGSPSLKNG